MQTQQGDILIEVKEGVTWVGAVDWDIRNFHGYVTHRGTSYNAYLVQGEKTALVDTVKAPFYETMLRHVREVVDPRDIDYIVANHAEPDHSGSLARFAKEAKNATIISSERGIPVLRKYYGDMELVGIKEMPQVDLGGKTLSFTPVPMAHWPDSMVSYIPEDKLLLSNDAFGQHIASTARFNDEVDPAILWQEATAYYANILMPLSRTVNNAVKALAGVEIEMIAPSHGVIWRKDIGDILAAYTRWVSGETKLRAVVAYDSMWKSTQEMAYAIAEGIGSAGVEARVFNLTGTHRSDVITEILEARAVLVGSPTLNNHVYPTVAGFLAYMRGLKPANKIGAAFGSYGWAGGAKRFVEEQMKLAGVELVENDLDFSYKPTEEEWLRCREFGAMIGEKIKS
jgi:anaerobic nitric oxide reductase flavorubredoxin